MELLHRVAFECRARVLAAGLTVLAVVWLPTPLRSQSWTSGSSGSIYYNGGNVGIGTSSPAAPFQVMGSSSVPGFMRLTGTGGSWAGIQFENATLSGSVRWALYNGAGGFGGDEIGFYNYAQGKDSLTITSGGNVGIGTDSPQNTLSVNGIVQAKEVLVNTGWSDYVFEPSYRLRPLAEVSAYIREHHHLPEIPSEAEVEQKGVSLGEMQAKLLAKIEELTLHMIRADERNNQLESQNRDLHERLAKIESQSSDTQAKSADWGHP